MDRDQNDDNLKGLYYEVLDIILSEMDNRFSQNKKLLVAIFCTEDGKIDFYKV